MLIDLKCLVTGQLELNWSIDWGRQNNQWINELRTLDWLWHTNKNPLTGSGTIKEYICTFHNSEQLWIPGYSLRLKMLTIKCKSKDCSWKQDACIPNDSANMVTSQRALDLNNTCTGINHLNMHKLQKKWFHLKLMINFMNSPSIFRRSYKIYNRKTGSHFILTSFLSRKMHQIKCR